MISKRPKSIRVLGKSFAVVLEPAGVLERSSVGLCDPHAQTITVLEGLHPEDERETLLHEIVHAVDEAVFTGLTENQVGALSRGLMAVFADNQTFAAWLFGCSGGA